MKIKIENTEVEVFTGAQVKDALLKYSEQTLRAVQQGKKRITDRWNNPLDLDGALSENQQLHLQDFQDQQDQQDQRVQQNQGDSL